MTPARWNDLCTLFGERGACGGCWCMHWRLPAAEYQAGKGAKNRDRLRRLVDGGKASGVIAYTGEGPIGWAAVEPRSAFVRLESSRVLRGGDDLPVWSVPCLFVLAEFRNRGVSVALLKAAAAQAKARGARVLEGYPVIPRREKMPAAFAWTGTLSAFIAAGFSEFVRHSPVRPIMRKTL
ncbi:MAG: GNAT family N-acetyltransferase [Phycisphaerales bacterium]|nr:GNAT family N-acetyltransferase [Phycisphaerales bacterium]